MPFLKRLQHAFVFLLVLCLIFAQLHVDVAFSEAVKVRYGLIAILIDSTVSKDSDLLNRVERYASDIQQSLSHSKPLIIQVPDDAKANEIQSSLEYLYYMGDGAQNEYNRLDGVVLVGNIPLPVVQKKGQMFPSIYPYVDFYRKAYIYSSDKDLFIENPLGVQPIPEIWHGIIKPPRDGDEGMQMLKDYFDKNHDFYLKRNNEQVFDRKLFFADFFHQKKWMQNEALESYGAFVDGLEIDAYGWFTGALAQKLQDDREGRLRDEGVGVVYDVLSGASPSADPDLAATYESATGVSTDTQVDLSSIHIPDIHSVHLIRTLWKKFYEASQKFASETNTFFQNTGRWSSENTDTPVSLLSKKDKASQQIIYLTTQALEKSFDTIVSQIQSDVRLIDSYTTVLGTTRAYVNGSRVSALNSAQDCSIFLGTYDPDSNSQLVEANRTFDPRSAQDKENYGGCYWDGNCNPDNARKPIKNLAGTELRSQTAYPDYRECLQRVTIKNIPTDAFDASVVLLSSQVKHIEPTGDILSAQLAAGFSQYLPIDAVRYVTYQANDLSPRRLNYPTHDIWSIDSVDKSEVRSEILSILDEKNNEIISSTVIGNVGSFREYIAGRVKPNVDITSNFNNWRTQTLQILRQIFSDVDENDETELFRQYMLNYKQLSDSQKNQLRSVFDSTFGTIADPFDDIASCLDGSCGFGQFVKKEHKNIKTLHDYFDLGGDTVIVRRTSITLGPLAILPIQNPAQRFTYKTSKFFPGGFLKTLLDDEKLDLLADAIVWKNLSVEEKHRYVVTEYLSKGDPKVFQPTYGYEAFYLVADGDSTSIDLNIHKGFSVGDDEEFSELEKERQDTVSKLSASVSDISLASQMSRADEKCASGQTDGVNLWEWVPYIFCWAEDSLTPPYVIYPNGENDVDSENEETNGGGDGASLDVVPANIRLESDRISYAASTSSTVLLSAKLVDESGNELSDYSGGSIEFEISGNTDAGSIAGDRTVAVRDGKAEVTLVGTGKPGQITVRAKGTFFDADSKERVRTSNAISLRATLDALRVRMFVSNDNSVSIADEVTVGGVEGFFEVEVVDEFGQPLSGSPDKEITLAVSDASLFETIETGSKTLSNGKARFEFTSGTKVGGFTVSASARDGSAAMKQPVEFFVSHDVPSEIRFISADKYMTLGQTGSFIVELHDRFDNVCNNAFYTVSVSSNGGNIVGGDSEGDFQTAVIRGQAEFQINVPSDSVSPIVVDVSTGEVGTVRASFEVTVLPEIRVQLFSKTSSAKIEQTEPIEIDIEVLDHEGNKISDLDSWVSFSLENPRLGSFGGPRVPIKGGVGKIDFYSGIKAGDVMILSEHAGWKSGNLLVTILPGDPKLIELSSREKSINVFDNNPVLLTAKVYDKAFNLVTTDNETKIQLRTTKLTEGIVSFDTVKQVVGGVATFDISPLRGKTGEIHFVAENDDLVPGLLALPTTAKLSFDDIKNLNISALYGAFLGAPIGDSTVEDYLAGWLLFSGRMQGLTAVSHKANEPPALVSVGQNGFFELNRNIEDMEILYVASGQDRLQLVRDGILVATVYPVMDSAVPMRVLESGLLPSSFDDGISVLPSELLDYRIENDQHSLNLMDSSGQNALSVGPGFDIKINDPSLSLAESGGLFGSKLAIDIVKGTVVMATIIFNVHFSRIESGDSPSDDEGMYIVIHDDRYEASGIYTGSSTNEDFGFEILDTEETVEKPYGWREDGVDDVYRKPGIGFRGDYKNMLQFASGNLAGDSVKPYLSDIEFYFGDPVISLKNTQPYDGKTVLSHFDDYLVNPPGYDKTVGQHLYRDSDGNVQQLIKLDFNNDDYQDVVSILTDGTVKLFRGVDGSEPLEYMGVLLRFPDVPTYVLSGDFARDGHDDLIALLPDGAISYQRNEGKRYYDDIISFKNVVPVSIETADMNRDSFPDLVLADGVGDLYIAYGSSGGFLDAVHIGGIGLNVDSDAEMNTTTFVSYPGMTEAQFDSSACEYGSASLPCDSSNYRESTYVPKYIADLAEATPASSAFANDVQKYSSALANDPATQQLLAAVQATLSDPSIRTSGTRLPKFTYFLKGSVDTNLSIKKGIRVSGDGAISDLSQPLQFIIQIRNVSGRTISNFTFADVVPPIFQLKANSVLCTECRDASSSLITPIYSQGDFSFLYDELRLQPNASLEITYEVIPSNLPGFDIVLGNFDVASGVRSSEDQYPDIILRPQGDTSSSVIYFVYQGASGYEKKVVKQKQIGGPDYLDKIEDQKNKTSNQLEQDAKNAYQGFVQDDDGDGIPNVYDIIENITSLLDSFTSLFSKKAYAQELEETGQIDTGVLTDMSDGVSAGLGTTGETVSSTGSAVETAMKSFSCGGGCIAMPINIAFLSPGMLNILGMPGSFMTGTAIFSLIPMTPFVSAGSNPASFFRFYLDPTLTLNLGIGLCAGPYLSGICYANAIPQSAFTGSFCDDLNADISMVFSASKNVKYDAADETDLGVVSVGASGGSSGQMTSETAGLEYGVEGTVGPSSSIEHTSKNKRIPSFPAFFANWLDKQWEEIVNSFTDFSDLIWYYPDIEEIYGAKSAHKRNALAQKWDDISSYDDIVDFIKNLPIIDLKVEKIVIKLPVIFEPAIWEKIQNDLKTWWLNTLEELIDFLDSFKNISCGSMDLTGWIGLREAIIEKKEISSTQNGVSEEAAYIDSFKRSEGDLAAQMSAMNQILQYREKDFLKRYLAWWESSDPSGSAYANFTAEQLEQKIKELESEKQKQTGADIGKCLVAKVGIGALGDISEMISSVEENIYVIQEYLKLPKKLVKYYDLLGHYLSDLTVFVDSVFMQLGDWVNKNVDRIGLWIQTAYTFEQYIKVWEGLIGLLEDYKSECSLCKSDRFTLKDFIMRFFVALPEIPVIPFPNWPDLILDTSEIQLGIPLVLPVFDIVFDGQINWPGIPPLVLPRLNEMSLDVGVNIDFQFSLPGIPVLPAPPELPDLTKIFNLPEMPEIRFPVLPLPPKLPELFDWIEPLMDIMKVFMKIVCLINQALIPIDEIKLKTQIENLTARQLDPLLPLDLSMSLDAKPMNVFGSFPDFIKLKGSVKIIPMMFYEYGNPIIKFMKEIANTWNQVQVNFFDQINAQAQQYKSAIGDSMQSARDVIQSAIDSYELRIDADIEVDSSEYIDGGNDVSMNQGNFVHAQHAGLKKLLDNYKAHVESMLAGETGSIMAPSSRVSDQVMSLAISVPGYGVFKEDSDKNDYAAKDKELLQKRISLIDRSVLSGSLLAQTGGASSSVTGSDGASPSVVLNGIFVMHQGNMYQLANYNYEAQEDGDVLVYDFDQDGDSDVIYAQGSDIYLKESYNSIAKNRTYPQSARPYELSDFIPDKKAVDMYRSTGDRDGFANVSWLKRADSQSYLIDVKDRIDGFEDNSGARRFFILPKTPANFSAFYSSYPAEELNGDVDIIGYEAREKMISPGDVITTRNGSVVFSISDNAKVVIGANSIFTVPDFSQGSMLIEKGTVRVEGGFEVIKNGISIETRSGNARFVLDGISFTISPDISVDIPPFDKNTLLYRGHDGAASVLTYARVLCMARETCDVLKDDKVHSLFNSRIQLGLLDFSLSPGSEIDIQNPGSMYVRDGVVEIIHFDKREDITPYIGMRLFPGDSFQILGSARIEYDGTEVVFGSGLVELIEADGESVTLSLPNGYYYSKMSEAFKPSEVNTLSFTEHLSPRAEKSDPVVDDVYDEVNIAIYTKKTVSASPYIEFANDDQVYWDLDPYTDDDQDGSFSNDVNVSGMNAIFGPYHSIGVHDTVINVIRPNGQLIQKPLTIRVFVPEISLSELSLVNNSQIRGTINPAVPLFPVSIVRERPLITELLTIDSAEGFEGPDEFKKYYTNASGEFALAAFDLTKGSRILNENGDEIIRILEENGRVIIHPEHASEYRLEVLPSAEDLPLRIIVLDSSDRIVASVFFVPEVDSDVFIDEFLQEYTRSSVRSFFGVHVKSTNPSYALEPIPGDSGFYPGGAVLHDPTDKKIAYFSSRGDVELVADNMSLREKFTFTDSDPVVFELMVDDNVVAEIYIAGDFSYTEEIEGGLDVGERFFDTNQNEIPDFWERAYGFTGTGLEIASADPDGDTLTNLEEYFAGTNPYLADTDGDGVADNIEVRGGLDPLSEFAADHRFNDVPESSPYFQSVQRLYKEGIIKGFDDNTYRPEQNISRAELLKIILGTTSCESCANPGDDVIRKYDPTENNPDLIEFNEGGNLAYNTSTAPIQNMIHYPDVLLNDWFYYCVEIATDMGIVKGYKGADDMGNNATGLFMPLENISRAEAVKVFLEAAEFPILSSRVVYDSVDENGNDISGGWYYGPEFNYIFTAVEFGLLEPDQLGNVYPARKITRGEMAIMAFKVLNQLIARYAYEDFDGDGIQNHLDKCICLLEDFDGFEDPDGCPESATQILEPPAPIEIPKKTGIYILKGEGLCQHIEPIADAVDGDKFYAIISDFDNKKVWRTSNELIWRR